MNVTAVGLGESLRPFHEGVAQPNMIRDGTSMQPSIVTAE